MEEYTYGITQRGIRPYGHLAQYRGRPETQGELTQVLGLASDCSAPSDCRGCLEDSTRVHRPGNWTGGGKRRSYPRVRGKGAASVTPASSSRPLPVTQHTGRNWLNAETLESCESVLWRQACNSADICQRGAVHQRMGGGNTPSGVSPHPQGARLALRLVCQGDGLHYPVGIPYSTIPTRSLAHRSQISWGDVDCYKWMEVVGCWACGCSICKHQCLELDASCNREPVQGDKENSDIGTFWVRWRPVVRLHSESSVKVWLCLMEVQLEEHCSSPV